MKEWGRQASRERRNGGGPELGVGNVLRLVKEQQEVQWGWGEGGKWGQQGAGARSRRALWQGL